MEEASHLKSDKDFCATAKLVGLAVDRQSDLFFRQTPKAFTLRFSFPGKRPGLQDSHSTLCLRAFG